MTLEDYTSARRLIDSGDNLTIADSFSLARFISASLANHAVAQGRDLTIRVLEMIDRMPNESRSFWYDIVEAAGLYPYLPQQAIKGSSQIRFELHRSPTIPDLYLHSEQLEISTRLQSGFSVVLSAPTSFGKSLLIEEVVASGRHKNLVIIQPTLALLDETRKKLAKYRKTYSLIVATNQVATAENNHVFLFTAERVVEYAHFPKIDFFVIDEFYKLSLDRDDDRALSLNHALYKLLKHTNYYYMLGPMVKSVPDALMKTGGSFWYRTDFSTVAVNEIDIREAFSANKGTRQSLLLRLLASLSEPTLIYCSSPGKATELASSLLVHLQSLPDQSILTQLEGNENDAIIEWVQKYIHNDWNLASLMKYKIAFHHGALPRHLASSMVDAFNSGGIKFLFCTSTLIEGVNTVAKNIILFDKKKGTKAIDYFDYRNIAGRSGRMRVYFTGNVFRFHKEPEQLDLHVDIPILTQENAPAELLIQIERGALSAASEGTLADFHQLDQEMQQLIRENSCVSVQGQMEIINELNSNLRQYHRTISWRGLPTYQQLLAVLELSWARILDSKQRQAGGIRSPAHLATATIQYSIHQSLKAVIDNMIEDGFWINRHPDRIKRVNIIVYNVFHYARNWFDYKLPQILTVVDRIQRYVFTRAKLPPGDYSFFASRLESKFLPPSLSALLDYDLPPSALRILSKYIDVNISPDVLLSRLSQVPLDRTELMEYEKRKIRALLLD